MFESKDDRVIGLHHNNGERNGHTLDSSCCVVFDVEGGRITDGREHFADLHNWDRFWS